ncbi:MAG: hypothetical protein V5A23_07995 [Halobacteriales archaeon]
MAAYADAETQREVGAALDIAPSTVSETLAAARGEQTLWFEGRLNDGFEMLGSRVA